MVVSEKKVSHIFSRCYTDIYAQHLDYQSFPEVLYEQISENISLKIKKIKKIIWKYKIRFYICLTTYNRYQIMLKNLKSSTLTEQATEMLFDYVVKSKSLKIGNFLPSEHELCKKIGISRSTLRESVRILESKGLVKRIHGKGIQIVNESQRAASEMLQLTIDRRGSNMEDLIEIRNILEVKSATLAAERATDDDIDMIEGPLEKMKSTTVIIDYIQADVDFHISIARATHNSIIPLILETIRPLLQKAVTGTIHSEALPEQTMHYHEEIFKAIKKHDVAGASKAMVNHLNAIESMIEVKV